MKLLDKRQIITQRSNERKTEIDEGAKLARTIDKLRETVSTEQVKLAKFREETLRVIHIELGQLIKKRDDLNQECQELEQKIENKKTKLEKVLDIENKL